MNETEKRICEIVLNGGTMLNKIEAVSGEGIAIECYEVEYLGEKYSMTKNDGEWVYFFHYNSK